MGYQWTPEYCSVAATKPPVFGFQNFEAYPTRLVSICLGDKKRGFWFWTAVKSSDITRRGPYLPSLAAGCSSSLKGRYFYSSQIGFICSQSGWWLWPPLDFHSFSGELKPRMDGFGLELRTFLQKTNLFILKPIGFRSSPRSARTAPRGFGAAETNRKAPVEPVELWISWAVSSHRAIQELADTGLETTKCIQIYPHLPKFTNFGSSQIHQSWGAIIGTFPGGDSPGVFPKCWSPKPWKTSWRRWGEPYEAWETIEPMVSSPQIQWFSIFENWGIS